MRVYPAKCVRIIDGDTYDYDVDVGFYVTVRVRVRLLASSGGVDTPEKADKVGWKKATDRVLALMPVGTWVDIYTVKDTASADADGAFGRWLAQVILPDDSNLGDELLAEGLAHAWKR